MAKITGIGGVFFKAKTDNKALREWYQKHLGLELDWPQRHRVTENGPNKLDRETHLYMNSLCLRASVANCLML